MTPATLSRTIQISFTFCSEKPPSMLIPLAPVPPSANGMSSYSSGSLARDCTILPLGSLSLIVTVGLPSIGHCFPHELSGGQKQCVCIARAILNHPELILADEPTGQLDIENGERVMSLLNEIRKQTDCTLIISTHNPSWSKTFPGTIYLCENETLTKITNNQQ